MLARYHEEVRELMTAILAGKPQGPASTPVVESLLRVDIELRSEAAALKKGATVEREQAEAREQEENATESARRAACSLVESEARLSAAIERAERLLELPATGLLDPHSVVAYAHFISATTSAPPEWRLWRPLVARILMPFPLPQEVVLPPGGLSLAPTLIPSMTNVSWLRLRSPPTAEPPRPLAAGSKRPREDGATAAPVSSIPAPKRPAATRIVAGFSDEDSEDE
jgi:hypothetical protein